MLRRHHDGGQRFQPFALVKTHQQVIVVSGLEKLLTFVALLLLTVTFSCCTRISTDAPKPRVAQPKYMQSEIWQSLQKISISEVRKVASVSRVASFEPNSSVGQAVAYAYENFGSTTDSLVAISGQVILAKDTLERLEALMAQYLYDFRQDHAIAPINTSLPVSPREFWQQQNDTLAYLLGKFNIDEFFGKFVEIDDMRLLPGIAYLYGKVADSAINYGEVSVLTAMYRDSLTHYATVLSPKELEASLYFLNNYSEYTAKRLPCWWIFFCFNRKTGVCDKGPVPDGSVGWNCYPGSVLRGSKNCNNALDCVSLGDPTLYWRSGE